MTCLIAELRNYSEIEISLSRRVDQTRSIVIERELAFAAFGEYEISFMHQLCYIDRPGANQQKRPEFHVSCL